MKAVDCWDPCGKNGANVGRSKLGALHALIVDLSVDCAAIVEAGLPNAMIERVAALDEAQAKLASSCADIVIVACKHPDAKTLDRLCQMSIRTPMPVAVFAERSDPECGERAVRAGVSAYVVGGLEAWRIKPIVELAVSRFAHLQHLRAELQKARSDLAARKTIERAKGILMERNKLNEADAYNVLRRSAMQEGRTIVDVAGAILSVTRLLKV